MRPGDIVSISKRPGSWALRELDKGSLPTRRWCVARNARSRTGFVAFVAGEGDITVIASPEFSAGQKVQYRCRPAEVVQDRADEGFVTVRYDYRMEVNGGGFIKFERREVDVPRDAIVLENMRLALREIN
jgi:hypothetical protein